MIIIQVQAQNVSLSIVDNSISIKDDSLYFKVRIQNNSNSKLVFYNLYYPCINIMPDDSLVNKTLPCLLVDILDKKNAFPKKYEQSIGGEIDDFLNDFERLGIDKYNILKPNEIKEYNVTLDIWPIDLRRGRYKLQLKYFSNDYYKEDFEAKNKKDPDLKNSIMFNGILKSNIYSFSIKHKRLNKP